MFCSYWHSLPPINCRKIIYNLVLLIPWKFSLLNCRKFYSGLNHAVYNCRRQIMFALRLFIQFNLQALTKNNILFYKYFYSLHFHSFTVYCKKPEKFLLILFTVCFGPTITSIWLLLPNCIKIQIHIVNTSWCLKDSFSNIKIEGIKSAIHIYYMLSQNN